jgi:hypothetical protein
MSETTISVVVDERTKREAEAALAPSLTISPCPCAVTITR